MAIEWVVFKLLYPFADFFTDSYSYIGAAMDRDAISYRPIGYSLFLRAVHVLSSSDTLLVTLQYVLVQGACLGLVLTMRRRCGLPPRTVAVLMAFLVLNPLIPYTCNYVSSDAMFIGLSIVWFTVLTGLIHDPAWWRLGLQVLLLFVIFHLRYVALFYPAVAALTILLMRPERVGAPWAGWWFRLVGVAASIGVVALGVVLVKRETRKETGVDIFSAFSGWQMANNALNIVPYIDVDTAALPSAQCRELARIAGEYFKKSGPARRAGPYTVTTAYMWDRNMPLHQYLKIFQRSDHAGGFIAWNRVAPVFTEYGYSIVRRHPGPFLGYYCWPSAKGFFLCDLDVYAVYNEGNDTVDAVAKDWFHYKTMRPTVWSATAQRGLLMPMRWVYLVLNIGFIVTAAIFLGLKTFRERNPAATRSFQLAAAFLLANACFCIFASPSVFRYQVLPMILLFVFMVCALSYLTNPHFFSILKAKIADDAQQR